MNYYNIYIESFNDTYTLLQTPEDDLQKIVEAYDDGADSVFVNGIKRVMTGLKEIRVFTFDDPWESLTDFINSEEARKHHIFSSVTGYIAQGVPALELKGKDLTKQYFNNDFGWKKKHDNDNILMLKKHYVNTERIEQLQKLSDSNFDFIKLIRICEEINICYNLDCFYAVGNLLRSLIDHIAPVLGHTTFKEVANNYSGSKSFREAMQHLENSLRKVSDSYLHLPIRKSEILPTINQVEYIAPIDLLLAEIIIVTNAKK